MAQLQYLVRPENFSNWLGLHNLLNECFSFMETRIDPPSSLSRMTPESLRKKAEEEVLVVVLCGDELVACGYLRETDDTVYAGKLAVRPAFRRRGILKSLMRIAQNLARDRHKSALEIETRIELIENHKTFGALGFVKTSESSHVGYDRPTSITMMKYL